MRNLIKDASLADRAQQSSIVATASGKSAVALTDVEAARAADIRAGKRLEFLTIGWNSLEALIALLSGLIAGSIALVGFGVDSIIEVLSGMALLWRLSVDGDIRRRDRIETSTLRIVGVTFFLLAAYVAVDAARTLVFRQAPDRSYVGIGLALLSLVVMPLLARAKRKVAARINSPAMEADSRQTDICAYLSAILVAGLVMNAAFGWWWADPVAALAMVPIIASEGLEAVRGKACCGRCG